jgi:hypothetical protein
MTRRSALTLAPLLLALAGCPHAETPHAAPDATVADVVAKLAAARDARKSFKGESVMDYWLGKDRVKTGVLVMGEAGAKVRFNGLSPAGDSVLVDLACNGADFRYLDSQKNCALSGPCDRESIGELLHIELSPDDFMHLALGTPPILANAKGTVTWDSGAGLERVALSGDGGTQKLAIDTRDGHWDVTSSELDGPDGKTIWAVDHTDYHDVDDDATHGKIRVPGKSRFKSPRDQADVVVEWKTLEVNPTIEDDKFKLDLPAGLPECHGKQP